VSIDDKPEYEKPDPILDEFKAVVMNVPPEIVISVTDEVP
jgi:hypothetical protein